MEARKYYANIVLPYGEQVKKALAAAAGLDIDIIAPSHGIIWRKHIPDIVKSYGEWSNNTSSRQGPDHIRYHVELDEEDRLRHIPGL